MNKRSALIILTVFLIVLNCNLELGIDEVSAVPERTRDEELFSISFPNCKTDDDNNDYLTMDAGGQKVIRFEVSNELASGQEFQLRLENTSSWPIVFEDSSDVVTTMFVAGHGSRESNLWVTAYDIGEETFFINVSLGNKYVSKQLTLISLPPAISLSANRTEIFVYAGGRADIQISIKNNLPETDTLALSLSRTLVQGDGPKEETWIGELAEGSLVIPGESTRNVSFTVYAPIQVEPSEKVVAGLIVKSANRDKEYTINIDVIIRSNYEMVIYTDVTEKTATRGESLKFEVEIENSGNDELEVKTKTPSLPEGWISPPVSGDIPADQRITFTVNIDVYSKALTGMYSIKVNFSSKSGPWEVVTLKIFVESETDFSLGNISCPSGNLYPGRSQSSVINFTSKCNHKQEIYLSIHNQSPFMASYFTRIETGRGGPNISNDFSSPLNLAEVSGKVKALTDQRVSELHITLGPFQEIMIEIFSELKGPPFPTESKMIVTVLGKMGSIVKYEEILHNVKSTDIRIISITIDEDDIGKDGRTRLTEDTEHIVKIVLKNELPFNAINLIITLSIDGKKVVASHEIKEIAPNMMAEVEFSWKTTSIEDKDEELLIVLVKDSSGGELASDTVNIKLVRSEKVNGVDMTYVILAGVFTFAIAIFLIYIIKGVKKARGEKEKEEKEKEGDREVNDFFDSDRRTYYPDIDYESMGTEKEKIVRQPTGKELLEVRRKRPRKHRDDEKGEEHRRVKGKSITKKRKK